MAPAFANALWLLLALPQWYFESVILLFANPGYALQPLAVLPAAGAVCLVAGIILALVRGRPRLLLLFALPVVLGEWLVATAGFFRGQFKTGSEWLLLPFLAVVVALVLFLVIRARGARLPAILLGAFGLTYALLGSFIAGMAFTDVWL
ncbi:MAG: hypothetical protein ABI697_12780 [Devosia sp.]